jgi:hypothetical protein
MNALRRALDSLLSLIPVPRAIDDTPGPVDPRVDPDALEAFGRAEIIGTGQPTSSGQPYVRRFSTERAADARTLRDATPPDRD